MTSSKKGAINISVIVDSIVCHKSRTRGRYPPPPPKAYWLAKVKSGIVFDTQYAFDGGDTGSTGLLRMNEITGKEGPSICGETHATCPKTINANNNFASEDLRLAA